MVCKRFTVKGLVQGVGYRASAEREALRIGGLKGFVRNLKNGDVEILVQGESSKIEALKAWASRGPSRARVDQVLSEEIKIDPDLPPFEILD